MAALRPGVAGLRDLRPPRVSRHGVCIPQYFIGYLCPRVSRWPIPAGAVFVGVILSIFAVANTDPYKLRFPKMKANTPGSGMVRST